MQEAPEGVKVFKEADYGQATDEELILRLRDGEEQIMDFILR